MKEVNIEEHFTVKSASAKAACITGPADAHMDTATTINGRLIRPMTKRFRRDPHGQAGVTGKQTRHTGAEVEPSIRSITVTILWNIQAAASMNVCLRMFRMDISGVPL